MGRIDNGVQTNYLVDPNGLLPQVLAETDASNNLISFYVYDGAGLVAKVTPSNQYYFYHYDGLGSTIAITDSAGQVVNTYCYSPEGLVGAQETIPNPFQYVGRFGVMAEGNGLYFMRARYYDPETGRFINKDPIGYAGGINLYTYVGNNLINWIDKDGRKTIVITIHDAGVGTHSAVYVNNSGSPVLYDPAGSYVPETSGRGSGDWFEGDEADLSSYIKYHLEDSRVGLQFFDTSPEEEKEIVERIKEIGGVGGGHCTQAVSSAIQGIGPFEKLRMYTTPEGLQRALHNIQQQSGK